MVGNELHLLIEELGDLGEVVFDLLIGVGVCCASAQCIAHNVNVFSIEEAKKCDALHFG